MSDSAPRLLDTIMSFHLYVAKGILTQTLGAWKRPVAYLLNA